jgi:hypothetical protein
MLYHKHDAVSYLPQNVRWAPNVLCSRLFALLSDEFGFAEHNEPTEGFAFLPVESGALDLLILRLPVSTKRKKENSGCFL